MNRTLIIFYDLAEPGQNREALIKKIKSSYKKWARLGSGAYLIVTNASPEAVRDNLDVLLTPDDRLFVGDASAPSAWQGMSEAVSKWILANQK